MQPAVISMITESVLSWDFFFHYEIYAFLVAMVCQFILLVSIATNQIQRFWLNAYIL